MYCVTQYLLFSFHRDHFDIFFLDEKKVREKLPGILHAKYYNGRIRNIHPLPSYIDYANNG